RISIPVPTPHLSSFPTRRSSDLLRLPVDSESPFWLTRKRERWEKLRSTRRVKVPTRAIVSIEPAGEAEMVCISVDAPDQLYVAQDRKSTRLNSSHVKISYAVFCL